MSSSRDQEASRQFSSCRYQSSHSHLTTDPYLWFGQSYDPYAPTSTGVSPYSLLGSAAGEGYIKQAFWMVKVLAGPTMHFSLSLTLETGYCLSH